MDTLNSPCHGVLDFAFWVKIVREDCDKAAEWSDGEAQFLQTNAQHTDHTTALKLRWSRWWMTCYVSLIPSSVFSWCAWISVQCFTQSITACWYSVRRTCLEWMVTHLIGSNATLVIALRLCLSINDALLPHHLLLAYPRDLLPDKPSPQDVCSTSKKFIRTHDTDDTNFTSTMGSLKLC